MMDEEINEKMDMKIDEKIDKQSHNQIILREPFSLTK